jgi:hypothetical protein
MHPEEGAMDVEKRIEELEAQVRLLSDELRRARHEEAPGRGKGAAPNQEGALVREVRGKIDRALSAENIDQIESRIGTVWFSRLTSVLIMTALALGTQATFAAEQLTPMWKALVLFGVAIGLSGYGLLFRRTQEAFAEVMLGCGLAVLYYATYAVFYVEQVRLVPVPWLGVPALLACLAAMGVTAHRLRSQTVAGMGVFLAYYTVVVSASQAPTLAGVVYALSTCGALAVLSLAFHVAHRWMLFSWAVLLATHGTYLYFFWFKPRDLAVDDHTYFWISNGFLTLCYLAFSATCILDARKTGEYRKGVGPMSGVNSFIYLVLIWFAVRGNYIEYEWAFRTATALMLTGLAFLAHYTGPPRNYLFQIFAAKSIIMFTLALQAYLSGEKLLVAMAVECLGLAFSYRRSGVVMFKVMGLGLLGVTFVGCLLSVRMPGHMDIFGHLVPANWFCAIGAALVFTVTAWYYEKFVRRFMPEDRTTKGQWFLADTPLDLHNMSLAIVHAAAAALIVLTITIMELGDHTALPYYLALGGVIMAVWGLVLRTPQIDVASVLLIAAAHVCFHLFLWWAPLVDGFEIQPRFGLYTTLLAAFTYIGALAWERYLTRYVKGGSDLEHHVIASLPYLAATFMLTTLIRIKLPLLYVPAAQGALGMALLLTGSITRYNGIKASGVLALALGSLSFYLGFYGEAPLYREPHYLVYLALFLLTFAGSERLFVVLQRFERVPSKLEDLLRTVLVGGAVVMGMTGLYVYNDDWPLFLHLLAYTFIVFALGAAFREGRYRWGAIFMIAVICVLAFARFEEIAPLYRFVIFGAAAGVTLLMSWSYARSRRKPSQHE